MSERVERLPSPVPERRARDLLAPRTAPTPAPTPAQPPARSRRTAAPGQPRPTAAPARDAAAEVAAPDVAAEFTAFMRDATPALGRLALFLTGDVHRAEELVQQTLVRTFEAWPRARAGDPLVYARRILANQRIDTWRRRRREVLTDPGLVPDRGVPDGARERAERDQLVRALAALGAKRRRVVVLRYLVGLPEREVADVLSLPVGTVKSTAARGLTELRALLDGDPGALPDAEEAGRD